VKHLVAFSFAPGVRFSQSDSQPRFCADVDLLIAKSAITYGRENTVDIVEDLENAQFSMSTEAMRAMAARLVEAADKIDGLKERAIAGTLFVKKEDDK
jgi:hypothetical protein